MAPRMDPNQKKFLVELITSNYQYLFGRHPTISGQQTKKNKWSEISDALNLMGPLRKNPDDGKKVMFIPNISYYTNI